ncbi:hypothetical protein [Plantactinospora sp. GCM10030261]|uniref:hypothetical protein n=1 Tax=Plantactinospora sp. GCM10030261 TaxID=3273420 RepID=UPI003615C907
MTAQPIEPPGMWSPDPVRQRLADYTIEDVLALPQDASRVELRDGVLIVVPSPTFGHQRIGYRLSAWLDRHAPAGLVPVTAVGLAAEAEELVVKEPFDIRLPVRDIAP